MRPPEHSITTHAPECVKFLTVEYVQLSTVVDTHQRHPKRPSELNRFNVCTMTFFDSRFKLRSHFLTGSRPVTVQKKTNGQRLVSIHRS